MFTENRNLLLNGCCIFELHLRNADIVNFSQNLTVFYFVKNDVVCNVATTGKPKPNSRQYFKQKEMPQIIQRGSELIRINPTKKSELDYSRDNGSNWNRRFSSDTNIGDFVDLLDYGNEILAIAKNGQGIYLSKDSGSNWSRRYSSDSNIGNFQSITLNGSELLATTDKGLYYSRDNGSNWSRK